MSDTGNDSQKRNASVYQKGEFAGVLQETSDGEWSFTYLDSYRGLPVSLTMPIRSEVYVFSRFPPVFEGLLPEGIMQDALLRRLKIDRDDFFSQLVAVGKDLVGSVTVLPREEDAS